MIQLSSAKLLSAPAPGVDANTRGWESVALKWGKVQWPRRPKWGGEFEKAGPLLSHMKGEEALVLGATPEFRAWLHKSGAKVSVYEKSDVSFSAMTDIMAKQLKVRPPASEIVIKNDWESDGCERGKYRMIMGDIVSGYMETPERYMAFLLKVHSMLAENGVFLLREFPFEPFSGEPSQIKNVDHRRWAYILKPGFAVEGHTFYEAKLAHNLAKIGDLQAFATCANPPRTRLMLTFNEYDKMFFEAGYDARVLSAPGSSPNPCPALWALWK
jgi:hypothetical protein